MNENELINFIDKKDILTLKNELLNVKDEVKIDLLSYTFDNEILYSLILSTMNNDMLKKERLFFIKHTEYINNVVMSIKDINVLKDIYNNLDICIKHTIIELINDDEFKLQHLNDFSTYTKQHIIDSINDDDLLIKYISTFDGYDVKFILDKINKEEIYMNYLDYVPSFLRLDIISKLSDEKKVNLIFKEEYEDYFKSLLNNVKNIEVLENYFDNTNLLDQLRIIKNIDKNKKEIFIKKIKEPFLKNIFDTNIKENKKKLINSIDDININYNIDKEITIGLELETITKDYKMYKNLINIIDDWQITVDPTVEKGIEIKSPILNFNLNSLKELYYICDFLRNNNFGVDNTCGGHIHLGFNYFKNRKEFNTFIILYYIAEEVLPYLMNRENTTDISRINKYAKPFNKTYNKIVELNKMNLNDEDYFRKVKNINVERNNGLNLKDIDNTLEFRIPNGEIDFYEIIYNIKICCKLYEKAKEYAKSDNKAYKNFIYKDMDINYKAIMLINMLFDDKYERQIYYNRFKSNIVLKGQTKQKIV